MNGLVDQIKEKPIPPRQSSNPQRPPKNFNPIERANRQAQTQSSNTSSSLQKLRLHYPTALNVASVSLHLFASSFPWIPFIPKKISKMINNAAIFFSRYIVPINMLHNAVEAISKKRLFEGLARIPVPFMMPFLPFFNFKLPYGLFAGINLPNEEITKRVGKLDDQASFSANNKKTLDGLKLMWKDLMNPQISSGERIKIGFTLLGSFCMLFGSVNGLLFAPQSLNNLAASVFGFIRSIGGLIGDGILIFTGNPREKLIGMLYAVGSFMDITQRWIKNPAINEIYNHVKTALDTVSTMLWTHVSTQRNMNSNTSEIFSQRNQEIRRTSNRRALQSAA